MKIKEKAKVKLIYNPHAGEKRRLLPNQLVFSLEDIKDLFQKYQIPVDCFPSKSPEHAIELAKMSQKEGYQIVVAAGGDGTVATIAHGLINSDVALAVLPMGSVMNIARMLAIPTNMELAVALIKIGKKRKIDVGQVIRLQGEKVQEPSYFIEQAGVGLDADYRYYLTSLLEEKKIINIFYLLKLILPLFGPRIQVEIDGKVVEKKARMVLVSNGPYSGYGLKYAPNSKLNDHKLTVSIFTLNKFGMAKYLFNLSLRRKARTSQIKIIAAQNVKINSRDEKLIHADARIFGTTPAEFKIMSNCLNVITGFPIEGESSLEKRTYLDL